MNNFYKIIALLICIFFACGILASKKSPIISSADFATYDKEIEKFYDDNPQYKNLSIAQKIEKTSALFLGKPYKLGALGEGEDGEFDQNPLYRTDSFDCMTFVSTVLALTKSSNLSKFQQTIKLINYKNGEVSYFTRNHFTNIDWNIANQANNFLEDYTPEIVDKNGKPVAEISQTIIDKPKWYQMKNSDTLKMSMPISAQEKQILLTKIHALANQTKKEESKIYYLPLNKLFLADGSLNNYIFEQIPLPSVIEIITPNNETYIDTIGTAIDVSHMGIVLNVDGKIIFREASSYEKFGIGVIDIPLEKYLKNYINNKKIKGINIEKII